MFENSGLNQLDSALSSTSLASSYTVASDALEDEPATACEGKDREDDDDDDGWVVFGFGPGFRVSTAKSPSVVCLKMAAANSQLENASRNPTKCDCDAHFRLAAWLKATSRLISTPCREPESADVCVPVRTVPSWRPA
ncbi:hypothetical protein FBU59_001831, partial [Linderina macrospora]